MAKNVPAWISHLMLSYYKHVVPTYLILKFNIYPNPKTSIIFFSILKWRKIKKISISSQENTFQKQISYICLVVIDGALQGNELL